MNIQEYSGIDFDITNNMQDKIKTTKEYNELQQHVITASELLLVDWPFLAEKMDF